MRIVTGRSPLRSDLPHPSFLSCGSSTLYASHPTWIPELPPVCLCIFVSQMAFRYNLLETQGRFSPSTFWKAGGVGFLAGPAFASVLGKYLNVLDRTHVSLHPLGPL